MVTVQMKKQYDIRVVLEVFHSARGDGDIDGRSTDEKRACRRDSLVRGKKSPVAVEEEGTVTEE
jgi:hypothetical protein